MESSFAIFFDQLKDPLLMLLTICLGATVRLWWIERKERVVKDKEKDAQFVELAEFGKDVVKLTTIWETKAQSEFFSHGEKEKLNLERYNEVIKLLTAIESKLDAYNQKIGDR